MLIIFTVTPGCPVDLRTTKVGLDFVVMDWKPPREDGNSKILSYIVEIRESSSSEWKKIGSVKAIEECYRADFLKTGSSYFFAISAQNAAGTGDRAELTSAVIPQKPAGKIFYHTTQIFFSKCVLNLILS